MEPFFEHQPTAPAYGETVQRNDALTHLPLAIAVGAIAALIGAAAWAALAAVSHLKIGYAAIGIGFLVGWTMRAVAKGHNPVYGYVGAALALLGCVVGDVLRDCVLVADQMGQPVQFVVTHLTPSIALELLKAGFRPLDALFYFLAARAGYRYAFIRNGR